MQRRRFAGVALIAFVFGAFPAAAWPFLVEGYTPPAAGEYVVGDFGTQPQANAACVAARISYFTSSFLQPYGAGTESCSCEWSQIHQVHACSWGIPQQYTQSGFAGKWSFYTYTLAATNADAGCAARVLGPPSQLGRCDTAAASARDVNAAGSSCPVAAASGASAGPSAGPAEHASAGDPIFLARGNSHQVEEDIAPHGGSFPLRLRRYYNSLRLGWSFEYSRRIKPWLGELRAYRDNGTLLVFHPAGGGTYAPDPGVDERIVELKDAQGVVIGWTLKTVNDETETYDAQGRLLSVSNRAALSISFAYSASTGLLSSATHFSGRQLVFTWEQGALSWLENGVTKVSQRIASVTDANGKSVRYQYAYHETEQITFAIYPDEDTDPANDPRREYIYFADNGVGAGLTGIVEYASGATNGVRYATWTFDSSGRATMSFNGVNTDATSITYNADGTVTVTNALNRQTTYTMADVFNERKLVSVAGAQSNNCSADLSTITYDGNGNRNLVTDRRGIVTDYDLNTRGLETRRIEANGTASARTISTTWHASFRVPAQISSPGRRENFTYTSAGLVATFKETDLTTFTVPYATNGRFRTTTYTYTNGTSDVGPAKQLKKIDGPRTDVNDFTTLIYLANGDLSRITNALGQATDILLYDARGYPTRVRDAAGLITEMAYDSRGRLKSVTKKSSQGDAITLYEYTVFGSPQKITGPDGSFVQYVYDAAHRLVSTTNNLGESITLQRDLAGNVTREDVLSASSQAVRTQYMLYDELSRLRGLTSWYGAVHSFQRDAEGNLIQAQDPIGRLTAFTQDALNRAVASTDPAGQSDQNVYDARDNLIRYVDVRGNATDYVVDGFNERIQEVSPDSDTTVFSFDAAGSLAARTDARGIVTTYSHDALNRLTAQSYADSTQSFTLSYDHAASNGIGRVRAITEAQGVTTTFGYNDRGDVTTLTRRIANRDFVTQFAWNLADNLTSMTYPSGRVVDIGRDALGRTKTLQQTLASLTTSVLTDVGYQPFGPWKSVSYGNGAILSRSFDRDGLQLTRLLTDDPAAGAAPNDRNVPPIAVADSKNLIAGSATVINVLQNDSDANGDVLNIASVTQGAHGTVAINSNGTVTYTASSVASTTADSFTYRATDGVNLANSVTVSLVLFVGFVDVDADGMSDTWEIAHGFNPNSAADAALDYDSDGLTNLQEFIASSDPLYNPAGYAALIQSAAPIAYWKLDDSGSTLASTIGAYAGSYTGAYTQSQPSLTGQAYAVAFNGGQASVPHNAALNPSGDYSIEFFLAFTGTTRRLVFGKIGTDVSYTGPSAWVNAQGDVSKPGQIMFRDNRERWFATNTRNLNDGQWRHYAFIKRGTVREIWINGVLDATYTPPAATTFDAPDPLRLMGDGTSGVVGSMDEAALYTRALSNFEVQAHFHTHVIDADGDNLPSEWEMAQGLDPLNAADGTQDLDGDGANNYVEYTNQTDALAHPVGYRSSILADAPNVYWKLDDATGTQGAVVLDDSGHAVNGSYAGSYASTAAAMAGSPAAADFIASGDAARITAAHNAYLNPVADYTLTFYLRFSNTVASTVWRKPGTSTGYLHVTANYNQGISQTGSLEFGDRFDNSYRISTGPLGLNDNVWRHYAFIRRGNRLEIWIDGVLTTQSNPMPAVSTFTSTAIQEFMWGTIGAADEAALYPRALSVAEIRQHIVQGLFNAQARIEAPSGTQIARANTGRQLYVDNRSAASKGAWITDTATNAVTLIDDPSRLKRDDLDAITVLDDTGITAYTRRPGIRGSFHQHFTPRARPGIQHTASGGFVLSEQWNYVFDQVNRLRRIAKPAGTEFYDFDVLDRLVNWSTPNASGTYVYDAIGNRTSETDGAATKTHTYASTSNRLTNQNGVAVTHVASGQRLTDGTPQRTFAYNPRGRLNSVVVGGTTIGSYLHDAFEQRAQKTVAGVSTIYVHDLAGHLIGEYRPDGSVLREYAWLEDEPVAQFEGNGQIEYLHPDHLQTPRQATDAYRAIVWRWEGEPFGDVDPNENPGGDAWLVKIDLRFPGQYFDTETRLIENWHRYYDPAMGRYVEGDPIGLGGGANSYTYAVSDPGTWTDPTGLDREVIVWEPMLRDMGSWAGHVSSRGANNQNYSFGPRGWDTHTADWYEGRQVNSNDRAGTGYTVPMAPIQDQRFDACMDARMRRFGSGDYSALGHSCVTDAQECLIEVGAVRAPPLLSSPTSVGGIEVRPIPPFSQVTAPFDLGPALLQSNPGVRVRKIGPDK